MESADIPRGGDAVLTDGANLSEEALPTSLSGAACQLYQYIFPEQGKFFEKEEICQDALKVQ